MTPQEKRESVQDGVQDTVQEKKEAVRQFIVRAVPSVMDLVFGCQYIGIGRNNDGDWKHYQSVVTFEIPKSEIIYEIIGRPITLADVLVAIKVYPDLCKVNENTFRIMWQSNYGLWDLSQDFDHQQEAFYQFAWELLV